MNESNPTPAPTPDPPSFVDEVSPDELMQDFRGHSLIKILVFTIVVHLFVLAIFSPGYIKTQLFGESEEPKEEVAELDDDEKLAKAEKDGKDALREIANRYGISVNELKAQLAAEQSVTPSTGDPVAGSDTTGADEPASAIERELEVEVAGPDVPDLSPDDEDDLFAPETP